MIAYLLLVHRYPEQFKRLFAAIYHPNNHYVIHIDKRSDSSLHHTIAKFLKDYTNADILPSKNTLWGGYSLVDAELRGIQFLVEKDKQWTHFINLSGQDFPLKTQKYIHNFLQSNPNKEFIKWANQQNMRPTTMHRIENFVTEMEDKIDILPIIKRDFLKGITPYIGNQWMILTRKFCEFLCYAPEVEKFKEFYKNTLIADEGFFQTILLNSSYKATIINDDLREIDWVESLDPTEIKLRPRNFNQHDATTLLKSNNLFARKFDSTVDKAIFTTLEIHLSDYVPLNTAVAN